MRQKSINDNQTTTDCQNIVLQCPDLAGLWYWHRKSKRSSGTGTLLSFGSIVQNGKFSAAAWLLVSTLKNVDFLWWTWTGVSVKAQHLFIHTTHIWILTYWTCIRPIMHTYPTLGRPTIPIFREVPNLPIKGGCLGASPFLGGICVYYKCVTISP